MSRDRQAKAFTLIELLVVVAIIGLLIAIILPSLSRARELSRRTVGGTNLAAIGRAYSLYAAEYEGHIPLCFRAYFTTNAGANSGASRPAVIAYIQRVGFYHKIAGSGNPPLTIYRRGGPDMTDRQAPGFINSKVWGAPGVTTAFNMPRKGDPALESWVKFWKEKGEWDLQGAASGMPAFLNYYFMLGDPGNTVPGQTVYYDHNTGQPYTKLDNVLRAQTKFTNLAPQELVMQDMIQQDLTSGFFQANYMRGNAGAQDSFYVKSGSDETYTSGYQIASTEAFMAGANVLTADMSVRWVLPQDMDKVRYVPPAGISPLETVLYLAVGNHR